MPIQVPASPSPAVPRPPAPQDPPVLQDVVNAIGYVDELRLNMDEQGGAGLVHVAEGHIYEMSLISASNPAAAPAWFAGAMQTALAPLTADIATLKTDVTALKHSLNKVHVLATISYNNRCGNGEQRPYKLVPFADGSLPSETSLPLLHTAADIRQLTLRECTRYLERYGAPHAHRNERRRAVARTIGCSVEIS